MTRSAAPPTRPALIWQAPDWPGLVAPAAEVAAALLQARQRQGQLIGQCMAVGLDATAPTLREIWIQEALATSAIEGEALNPDSVRSSVLRHLGLDPDASAPVSRQVDGLVDVMEDATRNFAEPLDKDRLCRWHAALFPTGASGLRRIRVGGYRDHADPMQIVSGLTGREVVHYTAPPSSQMDAQMQAFLDWFARTRPGQAQGNAPLDGIARAAVAHLWFESIHPFEDGNGRIGRAIIDLALAQDAAAPQRLVSLSHQLLAQRRGYYGALQTAQHGGTDVSTWVLWFVQQYVQACDHTSVLIQVALEKSRFWTRHATVELNARQRKMVQRLLDDGDGGFLGGLNAEKYIKMTSTSKATATRDLTQLVADGLLFTRGQGKALRYFVNVPGWAHADRL
jgi:Fic family protein